MNTELTILCLFVGGGDLFGNACYGQTKNTIDGNSRVIKCYLLQQFFSILPPSKYKHPISYLKHCEKRNKLKKEIKPILLHLPRRQQSPSSTYYYQGQQASSQVSTTIYSIPLASANVHAVFIPQRLSYGSQRIQRNIYYPGKHFKGAIKGYIEQFVFEAAYFPQ